MSHCISETLRISLSITIRIAIRITLGISFVRNFQHWA